MADALISIAVVFLVAGAFTLSSIFKEIHARLDEEDQDALRGWGLTGSTYGFGPAVRRAWDLHVRLVPKSRKRIIFASLVIGMVLAVIGWVLFSAQSGRL